MNLPPPGTDPTGVATYVDNLVREASADSRRADWSREADRGINLYLGNHFTTATPQGEVRVVLNRVQNCIVSVMAIQAGDPPRTVFTPRETGEPPIVYLNTDLPAGKALEQTLLSEAQALGEPWTPGDPLPDDVVASLRQEIARGQMAKAIAAQQGLPDPEGILPPEILVEVTDRTATDALQTVFDGMLEACAFQYYFGENVLNKNILGLQSTLYEFDDQAKRHVLTNVHQKQVFFDPIHSNLAKQQYAVYDEPVSAEQAKALWPQWAEEIDEHFKEGQIVWPGTRTYDPATRYQQDFLRKMGAIRHAWLRNQPYPLTPEQAVAAGRLELRDVPLDVEAPDGPEDEDDARDPAAEPEEGEEPTEHGAGGFPGVPGQPPAPPPIPTRPGYFLPGTDEEVTPTAPADDGGDKVHPKWPVRYGIRQITVLAYCNKVIDDRECELADIPLPTNVNIPVPYSPYGQGEPYRLEGLQMALNYVLSAIVTHQRYNAYPPEVVAESVLNRMEESLRKLRSKPGQRIGIPDDLLSNMRSIKDAIQTLDVPALPADFWKLLDFLVSVIDKEGNQSDVLQGDAAAGWSGDAINRLQGAASQVIRAKSMNTEWWVRDVVRLMEHAIVTRMGPADWRRYCSKYPWQALQALHARAKGLFRDVSIQIASGTGASRQAETQQLIAARQAGIPVSDPEILERMNVDPDAQLQKSADWQRKVAAAMPQPVAPAAAAPAANNRAPAGESAPA